MKPEDMSFNNESVDNKSEWDMLTENDSSDNDWNMEVESGVDDENEYTSISEEYDESEYLPPVSVSEEMKDNSEKNEQQRNRLFEKITKSRMAKKVFVVIMATAISVGGGVALTKMGANHATQDRSQQEQMQERIVDQEDDRESGVFKLNDFDESHKSPIHFGPSEADMVRHEAESTKMTVMDVSRDENGEIQFEPVKELDNAEKADEMNKLADAIENNAELEELYEKEYGLTADHLREMASILAEE